MKLKTYCDQLRLDAMCRMLKIKVRGSCNAGWSRTFVSSQAVLQVRNIRCHPFMTSTRRGVRLRWTHVDGGASPMGGQSPCGRTHRKLKLESTNVILSSSPAKKLVYFLPEFRLWTE